MITFTIKPSPSSSPTATIAHLPHLHSHAVRRQLRALRGVHPDLPARDLRHAAGPDVAPLRAGCVRRG